MMVLRLAWQGFLEQYRDSNSRLIRWTQYLVIFFVLTLTLSSASIQEYLNTNLDNLLGADMVISRYQSFSNADLTDLEAMSKRVVQTRQLQVTLTHGELWQRVQMKVVDHQYPLQGQLVVGNAESTERESLSHGPPPGELWVDTRVFAALGLRLGQSLIVGTRELAVSRIIFHEPDRIMEAHSVAMRAMVNVESFNKHALDTDNTKFRYLIEAEPAQRDRIFDWVDNEVEDAKILTRNSGHHPLALFWKRVENFIGLSAVLLFCMVAIAMDLASRHPLATQQKRLALMLSMGMDFNSGLLISLGQWLLGFLASLTVGAMFAYVTQIIIVEALQEQFLGIQPHWHWKEVGQSTILIFLLLISLHLPTFIQLKHTSVAQLLRPIERKRYLFTRASWNLVCLAILTSFYSDNGVLTAMVLGTMLSTMLILSAATWWVLSGGEKIFGSRSGMIPLTFYLMKKRALSKATQILGFGSCCTLMLFTLMLMKDIGGTLENYRRVNDGNLFISKANPEQMSAVRSWCLSVDCEERQIRPYMRAQLLRVNGQALGDFSKSLSDSSAQLLNPIRLSWSKEVPENNLLISGRWWAPNPTDWQQISVESEVMLDMGFELGDRLTFVIGGKPFDFDIVASHDIKPGRGSITFWFQLPEAAAPHLNQVAGNFFMGSLEVGTDSWKHLPLLWQKHPTLVLLPLEEITQRVDHILAIIYKLVTGYSFIVIVLTLIVVAASVKGFEVQDRKKNGLLRSMGVEKKHCLRLNLYEWLITSLISGMGAVIGTWTAGGLIYQSQFSLTYHPDPAWILMILLPTTMLVCTFGVYTCRSSLRYSTNDLLTEQ